MSNSFANICNLQVISNSPEQLYLLKDQDNVKDSREVIEKNISDETGLVFVENGGQAYYYMSTTSPYDLSPGSIKAIEWLHALNEAPINIWDGQAARIFVDYMW